jgi:Zn-dependent peptidase ImmA (M78 family)
MNKSLARRALRGALEVRKMAQIPISMPLCIYDVAAEKLKIGVRFHAGASFGGMYAKETKTILVPSERPSGRRAFTCAHEVGHWYFEHGTKIEDLEEMEKDGIDDPDEVLVNQFAGHLLMPKWAVEKSFNDRKLNSATATERDFYAVACQFGVGYETIITHSRYALDIVPAYQAERLLQSSPKAIKERLLNRVFPAHLVLVDLAWKQEIPIDLEVGDGVFLTFQALAENERLDRQSVAQGSLFLAAKPGISKVTAIGHSWAAFVRISRKGFTGLSIYRHLEDPDV